MVYLGADHAGFAVKGSVRDYLEQRGVVVEDVDAGESDPNDDYPHIAAAVAQAVRQHPGALGILVCGSAQGVCIVANKFDGIRAGVGFSIAAARAARADDDANILCLPGRLEAQDDLLAIVDAFLATPFSGAARHKRRLGEIAEIEKEE